MPGHATLDGAQAIRYSTKRHAMRKRVQMMPIIHHTLRAGWLR